jgi:hypothetical protein
VSADRRKRVPVRGKHKRKQKSLNRQLRLRRLRLQKQKLLKRRFSLLLPRRNLRKTNLLFQKRQLYHRLQ